MTRLRRGESLQADGIRDMMESHDGNGSSSSMAMNSTKIWERQPYRGGSVHTTSKGTTSTHSFNDHYGVIKIKATTQSYQTGTTKGAVNSTFSGWGTTGGVQAATSGNSTTQTGVAYDGTDTITNTAIPFSYLAPNADANKWISFIGYEFAGGIFGTFSSQIVFEGGGAQTTDTDWTKVHAGADIENDYTTTSPSTYSAYMSNVNVFTLNRSDAVVTTNSSRIVYTWTGVNAALIFNNSSASADFINWIKFE